MEKLIQDLALSKIYPDDLRSGLKNILGRKDLVGAEVGVERGEHAKQILENLDIKRLYLIDWYQPNYSYTQENVDEHRDNAHKLESNKTVFIEKPSLEAVKDIEEELDFVYIDGDHSFEGVYNDIVAYAPLVKIGGLVAGHDFASFSECRHGVMKYALENNLTISFNELDWWFIKNGK